MATDRRKKKSKLVPYKDNIGSTYHVPEDRVELIEQLDDTITLSVGYDNIHQPLVDAWFEIMDNYVDK